MNARNLVMPPGTFRMTLACMVFVSHVMPLALGAAAVYLFFALSGYWIYQMWHAEYASLDRPYTTFMASRVWRLLPVFYATLVVLALCVHPLGLFAFHLPDGWSWASANFYASHLLLLGYADLESPGNIIPTVWSLDIELQFYLVAPVVIAILDRSQHRSPMRLALYAVAVGGLAVLFTVYGLRPTTGSLPLYLAFFLCGMLAARHAWRPTAVQARTSLLGAAALLFGCIALPHLRELFLWGSFSGPLSQYNAQANGVLALLLVPYAMATVRRPGSRTDRVLGNLSYEVYLVHGAALTIFLQHFGHLSRVARIPYILVMLVAVAAISWLIYRYVDEYSEKLRRAYVKAQQRRTETVPPATAGTA
ncbi:acyltransferase [Paraburkholderia sp. Tr-20389]|uniref:acyltransferase family protein n=1 Tax=Paraburkholderia sp. Tr-20389 TaxID=2703903 RepID=UPI0019815BF7|nr:acyltransferase [Paraburkholderia sp. Tr-20389]MBN3758314.1 acyltransferase [Paraburkholderia sp. Tr-20389]